MDDGILRERILTRLAADPRTGGADLHVGVLNGIVHLAGTVTDMATRSAAEELAGQVPEVRGVVNRIEAPGAPSPARAIHIHLSDDDLERGE